MNNVFGVVTKPLFDTNVFKVGQPIHVVDYLNEVEFNGIIANAEPLFLEVLTFDTKDAKGKFTVIDIDSYIKESFEIKGLVEMDLAEAYNLNKEPEVIVDLSINEFVESDSFSDKDNKIVDYVEEDLEGLE